MTPMTPPPMFGIFHISTVLVGTLLAVFFAKRAAKLPKDRIIRLFGILGLIIAFFWFRKKYILTDSKVAEIAEKVTAMHAGGDKE